MHHILAARLLAMSHMACHDSVSTGLLVALGILHPAYLKRCVNLFGVIPPLDTCSHVVEDLSPGSAVDKDDIPKARECLLIELIQTIKLLFLLGVCAVLNAGLLRLGMLALNLLLAQSGMRAEDGEEGRARAGRRGREGV